MTVILVHLLLISIANIIIVFEISEQKHNLETVG